MFRKELHSKYRWFRNKSRSKSIKTSSSSWTCSICSLHQTFVQKISFNWKMEGKPRKTWSNEMWVLPRFGKTWYCVFRRTVTRIIFLGPRNHPKSRFGVHHWHIFGCCTIFILGNNDPQRLSIGLNKQSGQHSLQKG